MSDTDFSSVLLNADTWLSLPSYVKESFSDRFKQHNTAHRKMSDDLAKVYPSTQSGTEFDIAKNYAGGYDYGYRSPEDVERAVNMARLYQLGDVVSAPLRSINPASWVKDYHDAKNDFYENAAGIRRGAEDKSKGAQYNQESIKQQGRVYAKDHKRMAKGGSMPVIRPNGALARYQAYLPQQRAEANRKASVMSRGKDEGDWRPEYEYEPPLEAPMVSPDDLIGTGIPSKLAMLAKAAIGKGALSGLAAGIIKNKGGNWLSGSVEGALGGLKKAPMVRQGGNEITLEQALNWPGLEPAATRDLALNKFIDKPLTKYIKNEMATPEDPIRALAERGVLHVDPDAQYWSNNFVHPSGEHLEKLAKAPKAQRWENVTDNMLRVEPASTYQNFGSSNLNEDWINKLDPKTPFYRPKDNTVPTNLGFDHLIDELSNAINPESGLPRHLQFPADRLDKVSVPQAVERVSQINAWRAAQKAEADAMKANNAATHLHKEYPDKGFKWVELRKPELSSIKEAPNEDYIAAQQQALQDALKYEGDTMGHCVGGYCDDVASGKSRIFSLRDAKGQPHTTIEVRPPGKASWIKASADDFLADKGRPHVSLDELEEWAGVGDGDFQHSIVQIKGKGNAKPIDDYLPMVQDFVKSGQWSDVGDLKNSGLTAVPKESTLAQRLSKEGREVPSYMTDAEYEALTTEFGLPKYASGGSVKNNYPDFSNSGIISAIFRELQHA